MPPSHAASPAERLQTPLASARHAAIVITAPPQTQSGSLESQVPRRNKQGLPARSRPSPPSRSCPAHPQRKRWRVPKRRRFRHSVPRLSSISDAWGRLNVVTPFHHLSGDSEPFLARLQELLRPTVVEVLIDPFLAAQLSNAVLAAQAFQHNADLLFSGMMPACGSANIPDRLFSAVRYALARLSHRCSSTRLR